MSGNPANINIPPQTCRMYDAGGTLTTIDKVVNDYVTTPMTASNNNTATTLTQAGVTAHSWYVSYLNWRVSGGSVGSTADVVIQILDGSAVIYQSVIAKSASNGSSLSMDFSNPLKITAGNSVTVTVGASGNAGTVITTNLGLFNK